MNSILRSFLIALVVSACAPIDPYNASKPSTVKQSVDRGDGGVSDFYDYERHLLPLKAGVLLRQEALLQHQSIPGASRSTRLLYTSINGLDNTSIVTVSGTLSVPEGRAPDGGWPVLLWSHGTVGIADICAPSWTGYVPFHDEYLKQWMDQGYAILASDYQGLGTPGTHPYLATRPAAYSNLDLLRAAKNIDDQLSDKVVVVGQSQGAGAAIATAAYAPDYAPEVSLLGVVATGVPFFSPEGLIAVQKARPKDKIDPMLGYNFLALTLVEQLLPDFALEDYVREEIIPTARAVSGVCNRDMRKRINDEGLTYDKTFKKTPEEPLKVAFAQMGFPTLNIGVPIFVGSGSADRDTPLRMQLSFAKKACAAGSIIQMHTYESFDHLNVLNHSTVDSIPFVESLMSGQPLSGNCSSLGM